MKCDSQNTKVILISLQVTEEFFSGGSTSAECAKQVAIQQQVGDGVWRMSRFYLGASSQRIQGYWPNRLQACLARRERGVQKTRLQRAAARIDRISCVDFPRTRHGLDSVPRPAVAAVAKNGKFDTAVKMAQRGKCRGSRGVYPRLVQSRAKEVSAGTLTCRFPAMQVGRQVGSLRELIAIASNQMRHNCQGLVLEQGVFLNAIT